LKKVIFFLNVSLFILVNAFSFIRLLGVRDSFSRMTILKRIISRKYVNDINILVEVFEEELSHTYSSYMKKIALDYPERVVEYRDFVREWLYHELKLLRRKKSKVNRFSLVIRIYRCYSFLGKRNKALVYLKKLESENPTDKDLKLLIKYEEAMFSFDAEMDEWEIRAHPEKYLEKYKKLKKYINSFIAPIVQEYNPWALAILKVSEEE